MRPVVVVPSIIPQSSYVAALMDDSASIKRADAQRGLIASRQLMTDDCKEEKGRPLLSDRPIRV
jgi:hypothetical protein